MNSEPREILFHLLGPFSVQLSQMPVTPTAAKQRQILALLALNAGQVVSVSTLVEELWGDFPPRSVGTTLQSYIVQLRNRLAAAAPDADARALISTRHAGYLLDECACRTDVSEFRRLAHEGRTATETGDYLSASELLGQALDIWHGCALADMRLGRVLELDAASLEEARLGVLERRIQADLILRRHADLLGELTLLTARNPMNENFCALLMTALYRSGHVARALEAFQRLRTVLNLELGVEPCARLQRLQQRVLMGDPALDVSEPAFAVAAGRS